MKNLLNFPNIISWNQWILAFQYISTFLILRWIHLQTEISTLNEFQLKIKSIHQLKKILISHGVFYSIKIDNVNRSSTKMPIQLNQFSCNRMNKHMKKNNGGNNQWACPICFVQLKEFLTLSSFIWLPFKYFFSSQCIASLFGKWNFEI